MADIKSSVPVMLTLDPGLSDTKIVVRVDPLKPELLVMSPEVIEVSREAIDSYLCERVVSPNPESEAWVEYGGSYFAVGFLAHKRFGSRVIVDELKYEWAIAKVLAAVGVIALKQGLPEEFDLALGMPLPYSEWRTREKFEREASEALAEFSFCGHPLRVRLRYFVCVPEGGGHMMVRGDRLGIDFNQEVIVTIMFGFRDLSVVVSDRGVISGHTEPLGKYRMLRLVQGRTAGHTSRERERKLLETIHKVGGAIKPKHFHSLALSKHKGRKAEEAVEIAEAVKSARAEYWAMVSRHLLSAIPADANEIILGGGVSDYFRPELQQLLSRNFAQVRLSWSAELEEDVRVSFNLSPEDRGLCVRLTDAYGLSRYMQQQVCPKTSMVRV